MVAHHVAKERGDATTKLRAVVTTDADTEAGLAEILERQLGLVVLDRVGRNGWQAPNRIREVFGNQAGSECFDRRQDSGNARRIRRACYRCATRFRQLES